MLGSCLAWAIFVISIFLPPSLPNQPDSKARTGLRFESITNLALNLTQSIYPKNQLDPLESSDNDTYPVSTRKERRLPTHPIIGKQTMLFHDEDKNIHETKALHQKYSPDRAISLQTVDFIIRLQEKYSYKVCNEYLDFVQSANDNFFTFDDDLVNIANDGDKELVGDPQLTQRRKDRAAKTILTRYRLYNEPCSVEQEWYFWRDMFVISENDYEVKRKTKGVDAPTPGVNASVVVLPPPPDIVDEIDTEQFDYFPKDKQKLMEAWNAVWLKYQRLGVCNQRLLLECFATPLSPTGGVCRCRNQAVGLALVATQKATVVNSPTYLTFQYYDDVVENVHGEILRHHGLYVHKKKCVLTASFPLLRKDVPMINPCDFYLPMIGMCQAECQTNATCMSVTLEEKEKTMAQANTDVYVRLVNQTVHDVYDHRCLCQPGMTCVKETNVTFGGATRVMEGTGWKAGIVLVVALLEMIYFVME